jgi:hypothetical protein
LAIEKAERVKVLAIVIKAQRADKARVVVFAVYWLVGLGRTANVA